MLTITLSLTETLLLPAGVNKDLIIIMYFKANLHIRYDLYVVNDVGFELRLLQSSFVGYICS